MPRHLERRVDRLAADVEALATIVADLVAGEPSGVDPDDADADHLAATVDALGLDDDGTPDEPFAEDLGGAWWAVTDTDGNVTKVQGNDARDRALAEAAK